MSKKKVKRESFTINVSFTLPFRTKCKFCLKGPSISTMPNPLQRCLDIDDIKTYTEIRKKFINRMTYDHRLLYDFYPRKYANIQSFSHISEYKGYYATLHRKRGKLVGITRYYCKCWRTCWELSVPEISRGSRKPHTYRTNI